MIKSAALAGLCFLVFLIVHFSIFHFRRPAEKARSVVRTAMMSAALYAILQLVTPGEETWAVWIPIPADVVHFLVGAALFLALFLCYLTFYFTADRSITCRMLVLIEESASKRMSVQEMIDLYRPGEEVIVRRFEDMEYGGYLRNLGDRVYCLTPKGKRTELLYRFAIRFLNLGKY